MSKSKKYSELSYEEFINTPLCELSRLEQKEFPERCRKIAAYYLSRIMNLFKETPQHE